MMFFIFLMACKKYKFAFSISNYGTLSISLMPNDTFGSIRINQGVGNRKFNKLLIKAIKEMKKYREKGGC